MDANFYKFLLLPPYRFSFEKIYSLLIKLIIKVFLKIRNKLMNWYGGVHVTFVLSTLPQQNSVHRPQLDYLKTRTALSNL
jgi:hypothetical protein